MGTRDFFPFIKRKDDANYARLKQLKHLRRVRPRRAILINLGLHEAIDKIFALNAEDRERGQQTKEDEGQQELHEGGEPMELDQKEISEEVLSEF